MGCGEHTGAPAAHQLPWGQVLVGSSLVLPWGHSLSLVLSSGVHVSILSHGSSLSFLPLVMSLPPETSVPSFNHHCPPLPWFLPCLSISAPDWGCPGQLGMLSTQPLGSLPPQILDPSRPGPEGLGNSSVLRSMSIQGSPDALCPLPSLYPPSPQPTPSW